MDEDEQAAGAGEAATKLAGEAAAEHVADAGVAAKLPRRCSREDVPPKLFSNGVPDDVPATGLRQGCDAEQGCDRVATAPERTTIPSNAPSSSRGAFSRHIHQPVVFPTMFPTVFPATYPVGACA